MKEELTREVLEAITGCDRLCDGCASKYLCDQGLFEVAKHLATALLEEMDKPRVWDRAPDIAVRGIVNFYSSGGSYISHKTYTRELPKTRARKNAEELYKILCFQRTGKTDCINAIESALEKYAEELKGGA